jgi:murein DD-endopeptidase MepM/ murein hydrolase activator NlpD
MASVPPQTRRERREAELKASASVPPHHTDRQRVAYEPQQVGSTKYEPSDFRTTSGRDFAASHAAAISPLKVVVHRPKKKSRKGVLSRLFSLGALVFAGALAVGMSIPANAFMGNSTELDAASSTTANGQSVEVSDAAIAADASRANYTVTSYAEQLRLRYGNRSYSYSVGTGPIQWPFPYAVPISDGWGERVAPCRGCSSYHRGVDFTPGAGTPIYAIAGGTVTYTEVSNYGFGNHVFIEHNVAGKSFVSLYAHMQMNSSPLKVGDVVAVGDFVGLVGDTGASVGAHLHFELLIGGVQVDPYAWLKANAA